MKSNHISNNIYHDNININDTDQLSTLNRGYIHNKINN